MRKRITRAQTETREAYDETQQAPSYNRYKKTPRQYRNPFYQRPGTAGRTLLELSPVFINVVLQILFSDFFITTR